MIKNQTEIIGVLKIDYAEYTWSATSLLCDRIHQISNAKTYLFADSVLCQGGTKRKPERGLERTNQVVFHNNHVKELNRIDGMQAEFEWKLFPGFTTLDILEEIQKFMKEQQCEPEQFKDRIIFMSMFNDIARREKENVEKSKK